MFESLRKFSVFALLLVSQIAMGDVLYMKNGDQITGDIKKIWDGEVSIEPAYADEFSVDLAAVDRIESERQFEIELLDGRELTGQLAGQDVSGKQLIKAGGETVSAGLGEFFELDEPQEGIEWDTNVEFSAAVNKGNTDSFNTKLKADTSVRVGDHRHIGEVTFFREELSSTVTQEQDLYKYNYNWLFHEPWFLGANVSYERDPIIELHQRTIASVGIGLDVWNTPRRALSIQLGVGGQNEEIGLDSSGSSVMSWTLRYAQDVLNDDLEVYHNHSITENLSGRDNTSFKSTTGLRYEFNDTFFGNISLDYDYESEPVDLAKNEDIAVLVGIGLEF